MKASFLSYGKHEDDGGWMGMGMDDAWFDDDGDELEKFTEGGNGELRKLVKCILA